MKDEETTRPFGAEFLEDAPEMAWGMENASDTFAAQKCKVSYTTGTLNPSDTRTDWAWVNDYASSSY